jgi:Flp pilus assembly protein TadD
MPLLPTLPRALAAALLLACAAARADLITDVQNLAARGDLAGALRATETAAAQDPRNTQARFLRAVVLMDLQRNTEALDAFTRLAQEFPELPEPYNNIALLHVRGGRLELARQALETALRNDPGHRTARANLGEVHLMLAVQAWEQAATTGPLDTRLMRRLDAARALVASGSLPGSLSGTPSAR